MNILQITVILVVSMGFGDDEIYWLGGGALWSLPLCTQLAEKSSNQSIVNIPVFWIIWCIGFIFHTQVYNYKIQVKFSYG